ncbi:thioredoxin family protein [Desulfofustis glycolicus]|uniref:Thioredoxin n=1 Tax=Desulfofustis glycolicus DSM 9705 TaxID=1121409 RepID=A0A1M5VRV1_9BACT|nr:thioredoxin family protein [Desulfofustis glycolicus]MCB2216754.1 thioredoxin family protein [Desulfobulbaceae bacterium]SHH77989.1 thioredoxin [Desulfofustis glycolicus DSM 9705]
MQTVIVTCSSCGKKNRIPEKKQHLQPRCGVCKKPLDLRGAATPVQLGDDDFQSFIRAAPLPVMVDVFSPGCGPCRSLAPLIARCAGRYVGRVIVASLDTSNHPGTAVHYRIKGVPTLLFFRQEQEIDRIVGAPSEQDLLARLDALAR